MTRWTSMVLVALACGTSAQALEGRWTATSDWLKTGRVHVALRYGQTNNIGTTFTPGALAGLAVDRIHGASTPVRFSIDREAGRVDFEGSFEDGKGTGTFTFAPGPGFLESVRALGIDDARRDRIDASATQDERLLVLTLFDVSTVYIQSMIAEGFRVPLDEYQTMRIFDVTPDYVRAMRSAGFGELSAERLVATRIHGVTPEYIRAMRDAGWDLSLDELQAARIHNVTPEFRAEMAKLGYRLSLDELTAFRIHGVTAAWIGELRELGYDRLTPDELVSTRIFRVTPEFIRSVTEAGQGSVPMSRLISMRVLGMEREVRPKRRAI